MQPCYHVYCPWLDNAPSFQSEPEHFSRLNAMNSSLGASDFTSQLTPSSIPGLLWAYYVQYLWNYESGSWVARIAYSCRILAILLCLPIIILGMLVCTEFLIKFWSRLSFSWFILQDIASYGIARTLGVIDDVKASTSDKAIVHNTMTPPSIRIDGLSTPGSESAFSDSDHDSLTDHSLHNKMRSPLSDSSPGPYENSQPPVYYAGEENALSGVGVFSPAASQPPSPTLSRHHLPQDESTSGKEQLRHRVQQQWNGLESAFYEHK